VRALAVIVWVIILSGCAAKRLAQTPLGSTSYAAFAPKPSQRHAKERLTAVFPQLDQYFRAQLAERGATALSVGILLGGELVYARGFGVQDIVSNTPVTPDTVFRIASLSKSFTALAVLKLRDEGKLALDTPAASYLVRATYSRPCPVIATRTRTWATQFSGASCGAFPAPLIAGTSTRAS
jgi:CubicO group peptidase (beta-lactamase class C family)